MGKRKQTAGIAVDHVVVAGGGMVGLSLAVALGQVGFQVTVLERTPLDTQHLPEFDGRVCAIAAASRDFLDSIGVWESMAPHAQPIHDIRVVDGDMPELLHFATASEHSSPMGYIVENRYTRQSLAKAVKALPDVTVLEQSEISGLQQVPGNIEVALGKESITVPLLVACDGRQSQTRQLAGLKSRVVDYGQTAIVCTIGHSKPHHGLALEKFLPVGPFAVLPMTGNRSSLVWTEKTDMAKALLALDEADFLQELYRRAGKGWGDLAIEGARFSYPLNWVHVPQWTAERVVLAGDAAHGIHPLAGQGLNLGIRDVQCLAEVLIERRKLGQDIGASDVLNRYVARRRFDSLAMETAMHGFNWLFSNDNPLLQAARRTGLAAVEALPPMKRFFMHYAMGYRG